LLNFESKIVELKIVELKIVELKRPLHLRLGRASAIEKFSHGILSGAPACLSRLPSTHFGSNNTQ